jgi:hypothetical protein
LGGKLLLKEIDKINIVYFISAIICGIIGVFLLLTENYFIAFFPFIFFSTTLVCMSLMIVLLRNPIKVILNDQDVSLFFILRNRPYIFRYERIEWMGISLHNSDCQVKLTGKPMQFFLKNEDAIKLKDMYQLKYGKYPPCPPQSYE